MDKTINITVKRCTDCPFASKSKGGLRFPRTLISCNLQDLGRSEYSRDHNYKCFETCPLKNAEVNVKIKV